MTLEKEFDREMMSIYHRAKNEAGYNPTIFLKMIHEYGGLNTAKKLINTPTISDGYTALWEKNRLDLTVEAIVFDNPKWHTLFTDDEMKRIKKRLVDYQYSNALTESRQ